MQKIKVFVSFKKYFKFKNIFLGIRYCDPKYKIPIMLLVVFLFYHSINPTTGLIEAEISLAIVIGILFFVGVMVDPNSS